jgi:hypothetical protein
MGGRIQPPGTKGNVFMDWGGYKGHDYSRRYREALQQGVNDEASYRRIDEANGGASVKPQGNVNVKIWTQGSGVKYDASAGGFFQPPQIQRYKQMERSTADSGVDGKS